MREEIIVLSGYALVVLFWLLCVFGWVMNIMTIWNTFGLPLTAKFVLRVVGVFVFPIGGVLGYL